MSLTRRSDLSCLLSLLHAFPISRAEFEYLTVLLGFHITDILKVGHHDMIFDALHLMTSGTCCIKAHGTYFAWLPVMTMFEPMTETVSKVPMLCVFEDTLLISLCCLQPKWLDSQEQTLCKMIKLANPSS